MRNHASWGSLWACPPENFWKLPFCGCIFAGFQVGWTLTRSKHHAQCMHALQPRALVGNAALIDNRGCGLIGGRGGSNEPNKLPLDPPLLHVWKQPKVFLGGIAINLLYCIAVNVSKNGPKHSLKFLSHNHFTGCNIPELWNLPVANVTFLSDVSLLNEAAQYPSCDAGSVGSVVLVNTTLNTTTVAYYTGTTAGSRACFVCDEGYELNTTTNERVCQRSRLWSGNPIICGTLASLWCTYKPCSMLF